MVIRHGFRQNAAAEPSLFVQPQAVQPTMMSSLNFAARDRSFAVDIMRKNGIATLVHALWNGTLDLDHILAYKEI